MKSRNILFLASTFALVLAANAASAVTTGTLFGTVTDAAGGALPGVTVTITSPALQGSRTLTTTNTGEYKFPLLPPGTYRVEYVLQGFEKAVQPGVVVSLEKEVRANTSLVPARVSEAVTVKADAEVVDPTQTATQQNFTEDYLKYASIGQAGRGYQSVITQAAGVVDPSGGGNPNIMGSNLGQNSFLVDSLNTTDNVTHTFTINFGFEAVQEIALKTAGFEAEYGKAVGGVINVITKSGGNQFHGSLDARFQNQKLLEQGTRLQDYPPGTTDLANDKTDRKFQTFQPDASVGGPIRKDLLWFFGDVQRVVNKDQPPNTQGFLPGDREFKGWNLFGKLTATPLTNQTLTVRYTNSFADIPFSDFSSFVEPEAATDQYQRAIIYNGSYDAVLSPTWAASLQAGQSLNYLIDQPHSGDLALTGTVDDVTGVSSVNGTNIQRSHRDRTEVLGSTTVFLEGLGSHAIKVGGDLDWNDFPESNNATGTPFDPTMCSPQYAQPAGATCGAVNHTADGQPNLYFVSTLIPTLDFKERGTAIYAQDEWRIIPNLTLKAGLRYDRQSYTGDLGQHLATLSRLQPRLGLAWDVFNDGSTILRAHAGHFMDDNALTFAAYTASRGTVLSVFQLDPTGQQFQFLGAFGGPSGNSVDPSIKPTYSEEISAGVSRRLLTNTSADVSFVYRRNRNMIEDSCKVDNCQGEDTSFWLTNNPDGMTDALRSQYKGVILKVEGRPSPKIYWLVNYVYSISQSSVEYTQNAGTDFDVCPDYCVNRFGYTQDDARHRITASGFWRLPLGFVAGTTFYWDSGLPYTVTSPDGPEGNFVYLEPRGSRRLPDFYSWNLQFQKDFDLGPLRTSLIASVFNVLNTEIVNGVDGNVGSGGTVANPANPRFNFANSWQRPRSFEFGVRAEF